MKTWIICIAGFTERLGQHTGTVRLFKRLLKWQSPEVRIEMRLWDENWKQFAGFIANNSDADTRILVCAYSWGAGYGFRKLAKQLKPHGIRIETAVLCDPIYRSRTLLGRWLALVPGLRVKVPGNVADVFWLFQKQGILRGHQPKADEGSPTYIHPGIEVIASHTKIDESIEYQDLALREARRLVSKPSRNELSGPPEPILHD